jgi:sarcosine oxidase subunit alpha
MQASEPRVSEIDVLVVGGGPAGIMAALAAARTHARVILLDDQIKLGGHLIYQRRTYRNLPFGYSGEASTIVDMLWGEVQKMENVEYKCNTTVFGIYEDNWVGAYESDASGIQRAYLKIKPRNIVLAQGAYESFPLFENNDLPGIFPATGAQRLVNLHNVMLDDPVVVIARSDFGHIVASEVVDSGSKVVTLLDKRKQAVDSRNQRTFEDAGVVKWNCVPVRATGRSLFGGLVARNESNDRLLRCSGRSLVVEGHLRPRTELTALAGVHAMDWSNPDAPSVVVDEKMCGRVGVYVAGDAAGINSLAESLIEGYIAGYFAAVSAGKSSAELANEVKKWKVEMNRFQDSKRDEYGW